MLNIIIHVVLFSIKTFIYVYKKVWHFIYHCKTFHLKSQPSPAIIPAWCQMMNEEASRRLQSPEFSQMKQRQDIILTLSKFLTYKFMNVRKMIVLFKKNTFLWPFFYWTFFLVYENLVFTEVLEEKEYCHLSRAIMGGPACDEVMKKIPGRQGRLG